MGFYFVLAVVWVVFGKAEEGKAERMEEGSNSPRGKPPFVHAVADDEATAMPMYEGRVLGPRF